MASATCADRQSDVAGMDASQLTKQNSSGQYSEEIAQE
jgi:hypothetical protein